MSAGTVGGPRRGIGIVGAGQLARMTCEAASALGITTAVLAENANDPATTVATEVVIGAARDEAALNALAERCGVVTFDHEQVDLGQLAALEERGVVVRPGTRTLEMAVDKSEMRRRLRGAGLPVPDFEVIGRATTEEAFGAVEAFAASHGWPVMVKAARGGYDGKGVWPVPNKDAAHEICERAVAAGTPLLVEEHVPLDMELAVVVARRPDGESTSWPPVETAQVDGVCREVLYPGRLEPALCRGAAELARAVARVAGSVGVLAVELFVDSGRLLVNEVAARPHNSAHWTIEGSVTSQFENHLRAVLDLPLGTTAPTAPQVASVNVFGGPDGCTPAAGLAGALAVEGAHVHLYGKAPRPGRKLGHVTVCGEDPTLVRERAWAAAVALGSAELPQVPAS